MFTMWDYLVLLQARQDEIARAQHHNLVKSVSCRNNRQVGRLLACVGALLVKAGRGLQGRAPERGCTGSPASRPGVSVA